MRLAYWMYEGTAHHGIGRIANSMRNVHAVFHAPQGDDYVNTIFSMLERTPGFPAMTTSVVSGVDLSRGTIRLPETLRQVDAKLHPDLIVVVASCSTILLQENLEVAAHSAGVDCEVIVYDANPYRMQEHGAADGLFGELVRRYAVPAQRSERPSVNIIGPTSLGFHVRHDLTSLRRMLATLGIEINVIAPWGASIHDIRRLPAAWLTIAPYREIGLGAAEYLEEQFGVPAIYDAPIGVQPTLRWIDELCERMGINRPPLQKFSLDGLSAPSAVPWFARTADMESFAGKRAFVFGDATRTVGITKFLADELGMPIAGAGTYMLGHAEWVREQLKGYVAEDQFLASDEFQVVAERLAALRPELVCGTQMERHSARRYDLNCMVIAPPTHIENHLLAYRPFLGFDGADVIADEVYTTCTLGMEKHLIDLFGDAGLEVEQPQAAPVELAREVNAAPEPVAAVAAVAVAEPNGDPVWSVEAEAMLKKVPFFVRNKVRGNVEAYARSHGHAEISADVLMIAKESLGA